MKKTTRNRMLIFALLSIAMVIYMFFNRALIDDGVFHLGRLYALSADLSFDNIKPWIYSSSYYGLGYPLGIFYPDLFLYPFALIGKLNIDIYYCYILLIATINFATAAITYFCMRKLFLYKKIENAEKLAFVTALMYLVFPYRLWDVYFRMAIGECFVFIFLPVVVLGVYELFYEGKKGINLFLGMFLIAQAHLLSLAMVVCMLVFFYLLNIKKLVKKPRIVLYTCIDALMTILCCANVILPILEMQNSVRMYYQTGIKTFGVLSSHTLQFSCNEFVAVIITIAVSGMCLYVAAKATLKGKLAVFSIYIVFMCTNLFCWDTLENAFPFLNLLQFPYRLLAIAGLPLSYLLACKLSKHKPIYIAILGILIIAFSVKSACIYTSIEGVDICGIHSIGAGGEYLNMDYRDAMYENNNMLAEIIQEYQVSKDDNIYKFTTKNNQVVLPILYYKGYEITDGKKTYDYESSLGLILVKNVEGNTFNVTYKGTPIQKIALLITVVSLLTISITGTLIRKKEK